MLFSDILSLLRLLPSFSSLTRRALLFTVTYFLFLINATTLLGDGVAAYLANGLEGRTSSFVAKASDAFRVVLGIAFEENGFFFIADVK